MCDAMSKNQPYVLGLVLAVAGGGAMACGGSVRVARVPASAASIEVHSRQNPGCITVPAGSAAAVVFAAQELAAYAERMSGTKPRLTAISAPTVHALHWGEQRGERCAPPSPSADARAALARDPDAYVIEVNARGVTVLGRSARAVLYGAYDALEALGVRFWAPAFPFYDRLHEHVPASGALRLQKGRRARAPAFALRRKYVEEGWSFSNLTLAQLVDWMAKVRLNTLVVPVDYRRRGVTRWADFARAVGPELERRGLWLEVGGHGYDAFVPAGEFADGEANVFDVCDPEARRAYADAVIAYLRRYPEVDIFDAWPPDNASWGPHSLACYGSAEAAQAQLTRYLAEAVAAAGLPVRVEMIAYRPTIEPPAELHLPANAIVDFAAWDRSQAQSLVDATDGENRAYHDTLRRWLTQAPPASVGVYAYYRRYSFRSFPILLLDQIERELDAYARAGVRALGMYAEPADWRVYEPLHYLVARWSFDGVDRADRGRYLRGRYGAAADPVQRYLDAGAEAGRALYVVPGGAYRDRNRLRAARDAFARGQRALTEARARDLQPGVASALTRLHANAAYSVDAIDAALASLEGADQAGHLAERVVDWIEAHALEGIVLRSYHSLRPLDPTVRIDDMNDMAQRYRAAW